MTKDSFVAEVTFNIKVKIGVRIPRPPPPNHHIKNPPPPHFPLKWPPHFLEPHLYLLPKILFSVTPC